MFVLGKPWGIYFFGEEILGELFLGEFFGELFSGENIGGIIFGGKSWGNYFFETKGPGPRTPWARGYQERIRSVSGYPGPADAGRVRAGPGPDSERLDESV